MIIIRNKYIPFKGFRAIYLFGFLFIRDNQPIGESELNHELIHDRQAKELLYVGFYIWYVVEWIVRLFMKGNAYRNISFEKEAYDNRHYILYSKCRKPFSFLKYL